MESVKKIFEQRRKNRNSKIIYGINILKKCFFEYKWRHFEMSNKAPNMMRIGMV